MKRNSSAIEVAKASLPVGYNGVLSEGLLRADVDLVNAQGVYTFDFRNAKGTKQLSELLLKENDKFIATEIRFRLAVRRAAKPTTHVLQTYPNPIIFADETGATPAGTFVPEDLETIYNVGYLQYRKGDTIYMQSLPLLDARFVSQTQQSALTNKSSTESQNSGIISLQKPLILSGSDVGDLTLNVPGANNALFQFTTPANLTTNGLRIVAVCILHGVLASGGSKIATSM